MKNSFYVALLLAIASCSQLKEKPLILENDFEITGENKEVLEEVIPLEEDTEVAGELVTLQTDRDAFIRMSGSWWKDPANTVEGLLDVSWGEVTTAFMVGIVIDLMCESPVVYIQDLPGPHIVRKVFRITDYDYKLLLEIQSGTTFFLNIHFFDDYKVSFFNSGIIGAPLLYGTGLDVVWYKIDGYMWTDEDKKQRRPADYMAYDGPP